jgi:CBS-domain-containing membrane protein
MRVHDVMTEGVKTIAPPATAENAWSLMRLHGIHHLVVTKANRVVGVLSGRDASGRRGATVRMNSAVADLMNCTRRDGRTDDDCSSGGQRDARPLDRLPCRGRL